MTYPLIIQGGMGVAVSDWRLARAVSICGQLGVVSGTGIDSVLVRRLQLGDPGGHLRRAFDHFPVREIADAIWRRYFIEGGKRATASFRSKPMPSISLTRAFSDLVVLANFVEVFLAKEGHRGLVGINLLEKIQIPTLPSLLGAMMAGVDYVLMGAGIPRAIPAVLDNFANLQPAELKIDVIGARPNESFSTKLDPTQYASAQLPRPQFLAIVSSSALATTLARKSTGQVNGFVVEDRTAGGHNAPPRGAMQLDSRGEPIYGERDNPDFQAIRELGLPFWLAGSYGSPERLRQALELGATGVQVGTPFAFCEESGIAAPIKQAVLEKVASGAATIFTDPSASPTAFPFKVVQLEGSVSDPRTYDARERICDLGYLRQVYRKADGTIGYRCGAEPVDDYMSKDGESKDFEGKRCLCNGLLATAGFPQVRKSGYVEPPLVTAGDSLVHLSKFLEPGRSSYRAADVIEHILAGVECQMR